MIRVFMAFTRQRRKSISMQWSKRDWLIFAAGAQAFHTFSHFILGISVSLPIQIVSFSFTQGYNLWTIIINGANTHLLLWLVSKER